MAKYGISFSCQYVVRRSSDQEALAGLVEGSFRILLSSGNCKSVGAVYFSNSSQALLPLPKMAVIEVCASRFGISAGMTLRMLLSEEPMISQLWITSQTAICQVSRNCFFSETVVGRGSLVIAASTFQNRFCGWP